MRTADQPDWFRRFGGDAPDLGWSGFATGGVHVIVVPGRRAHMLREPAVGQLKDAIWAALRAGPTTTG